jgi:peptide chain release factor 1
VIDRLEALTGRHQQLQDDLSRPEVIADHQKLAELGRELRGLEELVGTYREYTGARQQLDEARDLMRAEKDLDMQAYLRGEIQEAERRLAGLGERLRVLLLPKDPHDDRDVVVEIQGAEGGREAALFAADLFRMYSRWAESRGWKIEIIEKHETELGGFDKIAFEVHVPVTESQGRIHTSAATVVVVPEPDPVEVQLPEKDLKVETSTSTGPGGQSVNTTYSAIRVTHLPTGLVVSIQDEKSQLKNKDKALRVLRTRLYEMKLAEQQAEQSAARQTMVRSGNRSEKIRTYNFKEGRVTDHRINLTLWRLEQIMQGDLDELVTLLAAAERERQLEAEGAPG